MGRVIVWACAGLVGVLLLTGAVAAGVLSALTGGAGGGMTDCLAATGPAPALSADQEANAVTIVTVGQGMGVPAYGWVIAVAVALQESNLVNVTGGDRDSVGLFQQRPSQGWGTPAQLTDSAYAAGAFYRRLLTVPDWQTVPLAVAAQQVQRSAYPDAYADHEQAATAIVATITGGTVPTCPTGGPVLTRAATWLTAWHGGPVPYLSSGDPGTWFNGYRRDCSGYASMSLGVPGPGLTSAGLADRSTPISKTDLRAGDLLINPAPDLAGHVVIFDHWTDASMTRYVGYEQSGDGGTHHRPIPYPYFHGYPMSPFRYAGA